MIDIRSRLEQSGLSADKLAERAGLSFERMQTILGGKDFSLEELQKIANALKIRVSEFLHKPAEQEKAELLFRRCMHKEHSSKFRESIHAYSLQIANTFSLTASLHRNLRWLSSFPKSLTTYEGAARNAALFRRHYFGDDQVSPIFDLPTIVSRDLGVFLFVLPGQAVDGASAIIAGRAFIFLAPLSFRPRMLFTLAHELGHLIGQHHEQEDFAALDEAEHVGTIRKQRKQIEQYADAFASNLLLPETGVAVALRKIKEHYRLGTNQVGDIELLYLARIFGVSFEVAARRCEDLTLLPRGGARSLYQKIVKEHGSPEKRADKAGLPPRAEIELPIAPPQLLEGAVERIRAGHLSVGRASVLLRISIQDLFAANVELAV